MDQIVQVLGSLLILSAFVAAQRGWLSTQSRLYLTLNLLGASVLAVLAAHERLVGFLLLEFVWALVAAHSLLASFNLYRKKNSHEALSRASYSPAASENVRKWRSN